MTIKDDVIQENLRNVEKGKALTMPLKILNGEFKKAYKDKFGEFEKLSPEEVKAYNKAYYQRMKKLKSSLSNSRLLFGELDNVTGQTVKGANHISLSRKGKKGEGK
jgi:hypothetical protein